MIPVEQRIMAVFDENGDNVVAGDCMRACVASIFELPIDEVPHFAALDDWYGEWMRWLRARGLQLGRAWYTLDEDDPTKLSGWPGDLYWLATVKSPRGKTRCAVCKGEKVALEQWLGSEERYVKYDEPQPCVNCDASGLEPSLHCVVMFGRELVWDPHPRRDMGHLGFVQGELFQVIDPARLLLAAESRAREPEAVSPHKERESSVA